MGGNPLKHYITIFTSATIAPNSESLQNLEPHKCESWNWVPWDDIIEMSENSPDFLFDPIVNLCKDLKSGEIFSFNNIEWL